MKKLSIAEQNLIVLDFVSGWTAEDDARINRDTANYHRSVARIGIKHYPETKEKISLALKGRPSVIVECPHCAKKGGNSAMHRWHFDKCKLKQS